MVTAEQTVRAAPCPPGTAVNIVLCTVIVRSLRRRDIVFNQPYKIMNIFAQNLSFLCQLVQLLGLQLVKKIDDL